MTNITPLTALLYEHEDGRYAVNPDTTGDPGWHRLGPVDVSALAAQAGAPAAPIESVLIDGAAYDIPTPVARELLRLKIDLQQAAAAAVAPHIAQPYTLAEIKAQIASHDYSAELLLQHAMLLLEPAAVAGPILPTEAEIVAIASRHTRTVATPTRYVTDAAAAIKDALARWGTAPTQAEPQPGDLLDEFLRKLEDGEAPFAVVKTGSMISVPWELLSAACCLIDKKRDAPKILAQLRRYVWGDLSCAMLAAAPAHPAERVPALPDAVRVPLDSLHADAEYLCARLLDKSLTREEVVTAIRARIDAVKAARARMGDAAPLAPAVPVDDLAQLVKQLVRALRKAAPGNDLAEKALDYLKRQGLQGSPLRAAPEAPPTHAGLLAAAAHIQAKAQAHAEEFGSYDPDTGAVEMSNSNQEHYNTLDELAEEIRMMADKAAPCDKPPAGWTCSRAPGHDGPCAAAPAAPSGLPSGWVPCILTHNDQHPEEVAYGPQIMMDRLKKWLGRYFELLAQAAPAAPAVDAPDIDRAAKRLAELFDYPWDQMPSEGRENMRENVRDVLSAAQAKEGGPQ